MRTLYLNGHIYSTSVGDASAFLVDQQQVVWLGDDSLARELAADVRVDLQGAFVAPAFVDAHVHSTALGLHLAGDLSSSPCSLASAQATANLTTAARRELQTSALSHLAAQGIACIHEMTGPQSGKVDMQQLCDLADGRGPEVVAHWSSQCLTESDPSLMLDAIEHSRSESDTTTPSARIDLCADTALEDVTRLASLRVTVSVRPRYITNAHPATPQMPYKELATHGVPLILGSASSDGDVDPWGAVRAVAYPADPATAISPRAAFLAHTRGGWRILGRDADGSGTLAPGAPATFAVWQTGELGVDSADDRLSRWSTDPRSTVPGLPDLRPGLPLPTCIRTVRAGEVIFDNGVLV